MECAILDTVSEMEEIPVDAPYKILHDAPQPMIKSLHVENFRCFEKLTLENFGWFNIVVGKNGAGKTAFLESIFMPGGGHDLALRLRAYRGLAVQQITPVRAVYESAWRDLFHKFSQDRPITILLNGTEPNSRALKIYYNPESVAPVPLGFQSKEAGRISKGDASSIIPITFETDALDKKYYNNAIFDPNGILVRTGEVPPVANIAFQPTTLQFTLAQQFSAIDLKNQKAKLVSTLKGVFPNIEDLSLQVVNNATDLYCTVKALPEKIPVGLVSNGVHKLLSNLVSIADRADGVVLIDEIENGIYHGSLENAWRAIFTFCKQYNVQIFASTHSKECLNALIPFLEEYQSDFRLIRLEELNDGKHAAKIFNGNEFESALETGIDPR